MGGATYTQREDFFFPYLLPGAKWCQRLHPLASSSETPLVGCVSPARLRFSAPCLNLTTWSSSSIPSGYTPVRPECPDTVIFLFTNQNVTANQSTRGHLELNENPCHMLYNLNSYIHVYLYTIMTNIYLYSI